MAVRAERFSITDDVAKVRRIRPPLYVMSMEVAASHVATLAGVVVPLEHLLPPSLVFVLLHQAMPLRPRIAAIVPVIRTADPELRLPTLLARLGAQRHTATRAWFACLRAGDRAVDDVRLRRYSAHNLPTLRTLVVDALGAVVRSHALHEPALGIAFRFDCDHRYRLSASVYAHASRQNTANCVAPPVPPTASRWIVFAPGTRPQKSLVAMSRYCSFV